MTVTAWGGTPQWLVVSARADALPRPEVRKTWTARSVGDDAGAAVDLGLEVALEAVEVEAEAEDLAAAAEPADDLEQPVDLAGEVAGAQLGGLAALREVGRRLGVAEHDVRAGVDELAHSGPLVHTLVEA